MAGLPQPHPPFHWPRELVVPVLMLGGIGVFLYDSVHLSVEALLLPAALIVVVVASLLWALAAEFLRAGTPAAADAAAEGEDDAPGPILNLKAWLLVALPAALFLLLDVLGALAALVLLVFGAQLIFTTKAPVRSLLIALAVTAPTYAFFKFFLYARFPAGLLGLG